MNDPTPRRRGDVHVIRTLQRHGELDRAQLVRLSGLARSTITEALARLLRDGVVVEHPTRRSITGKVGRPPTVVSLAAPAGLVGVLAMSHGGVQAALVGFDGMIRGARSVARSTALVDDPLQACIELLDGVLADADLARDALACAVIGVPLPFQPRRGARWPTSWRGRTGSDGSWLSELPAWLENDPAAALAERLHIPTWAENDANLGALGEATFGVAQGMRGIIYVKIVEGLGAGIVLNGELVHGASGLAGELGHIHVRDDGPLCPCGGRGCLLTQFSTQFLVEMVQHSRAETLTLDDVLNLARQGDPGVLRVLSDLGRTLGRSLADFCVYFNPEGIILDSMLGPASEPVSAGIREALNRFAPPLIVADVQVLPGALRSGAEILGAAALARKEALRS